MSSNGNYNCRQPGILIVADQLGSFGRKGQGPGEFHDTGMYGHVSIDIGRDGNLYANDIHARRMMALDRLGKPLKTFSIGKNFYIDKPVGDKNGNILFVTKKEGKIQVINGKGDVLGQYKSEKLHHGFLFEDPGKLNREKYEKESFAPNAVWGLTIDGKLLVYFTASASLAVFTPNGKEYEYVKTLKLWPREALQLYKERYRREKEKDKNSPLGKKYSFKSDLFLSMFGKLLIDQDNKNVFYLAQGIIRTKQKISSTWYTFNLNGQLLKVIHFPVDREREEPGYARIDTKVNNIFYATRGGSEEVVLFKEKNK